MRAMKDSGIEWIGEIPAHWELKRLKAIFVERKEKNDPQKTDFILSLGANYGVVPYSEKEGGGNKAKEELTDYRLAYPNDIVMNSMNIISGSVGISKYFGCVSPVYYMLYPRADDTNNNFYCMLFQTKAFQRSLLGLGNGILMKESSTGTFNTVRMRIPMEKLGVQLLPVPPYEEQRRIADFLDAKCAEIDRVVAETEETIEEYKTLKQSVITEAVTKGVRGDRPMKDSGIEWIGEIPEEWDVVRIGSQYTERHQKVSDTEYAPLSVTMKGILPQLATAAKTDAHDDRKLVCKGDFAINSRSDRRGSCGISPCDGSVSLINTILCPRDEINPKYHDWLFHSTMFSDEFYSWGHGIVDDLWTTNWQDMKKISIPKPSLSEQQEIADYLDTKCAEIDKLIDAKQKLLAEMETYKKSVIYEYVTGKKEVV